MKHGYTTKRSQRPEYSAWAHMIHRCTNPNSAVWKHYGGRGIQVCERWRDFRNFLVDMGDRPQGLTLERKDNDGNYEPTNCVWASPAQQANNRRFLHLVTIGNETHTIRKWCELNRLKELTVYQRLRAGWDERIAITKPAKKIDQNWRAR